MPPQHPSSATSKFGFYIISARNTLLDYLPRRLHKAQAHPTGEDTSIARNISVATAHTSIDRELSEHPSQNTQNDNQGASVCGLQSSQPVLTWYGFRSFVQTPGRNRFQRKLSGTEHIYGY
jgi:hypothetical protein